MEREKVRIGLKVKITELFKTSSHVIRAGIVFEILSEPFRKHGQWYCQAATKINWSMVICDVPLASLKPV